MSEGAKYLMTDMPLYYIKVAGSWVRKYSSSYYSASANAILADFQANPATGTGISPVSMNNNDPATSMATDAVNEYGEVDFKKAVKIDQWRYYGYGSMNGDGTYKIQYIDADGALNDWVTGIATRLASWTTMSSETEVIAVLSFPSIACIQ